MLNLVVSKSCHLLRIPHSHRHSFQISTLDEVLCCTLLLPECLFGRPPFTSKTVRELEDRIYDTTPVEVIE